MLRLRELIGCATQRRWLGLIVIALLVGLLALVMLHNAEHGLEAGNLMLCVALVLAGSLTLVRPAPSLHPTPRQQQGRGPPQALTAFPGPNPFTAAPTPLRR